MLAAHFGIVFADPALDADDYTPEDLEDLFGALDEVITDAPRMFDSTLFHTSFQSGRYEVEGDVPMALFNTDHDSWAVWGEDGRQYLNTGLHVIAIIDGKATGPVSKETLQRKVLPEDYDADVVRLVGQVLASLVGLHMPNHRLDNWTVVTSLRDFSDQSDRISLEV